MAQEVVKRWLAGADKGEIIRGVIKAGDADLELWKNNPKTNDFSLYLSPYNKLVSVLSELGERDVLQDCLTRLYSALVLEDNVVSETIEKVRKKGDLQKYSSSLTSYNEHLDNVFDRLAESNLGEQIKWYEDLSVNLEFDLNEVQTSNAKIKPEIVNSHLEAIQALTKRAQGLVQGILSALGKAQADKNNESGFQDAIEQARELDPHNRYLATIVDEWVNLRKICKILKYEDELPLNANGKQFDAWLSKCLEQVKTGLKIFGTTNAKLNSTEQRLNDLEKIWVLVKTAAYAGNVPELEKQVRLLHEEGELQGEKARTVISKLWDVVSADQAPWRLMERTEFTDKLDQLTTELDKSSAKVGDLINARQDVERVS